MTWPGVFGAGFLSLQRSLASFRFPHLWPFSYDTATFVITQ
jgi:hypothetical protein